MFRHVMLVYVLIKMFSSLVYVQNKNAESCAHPHRLVSSLEREYITLLFVWIWLIKDVHMFLRLEIKTIILMDYFKLKYVFVVMLIY